MKVVIEIQDRQGNKQAYELALGRYVLGKSDKCDIMLPDSHVSRNHAVLEISDTDVILSDNNSTNGTWFEGQRILNPILLQTGDVLRVGALNIVVNSIELEAEAPASVNMATEPSGDMLDDPSDLFLDDDVSSDSSVAQAPEHNDQGSEQQSAMVGDESFPLDFGVDESESYAVVTPEQQPVQQNNYASDDVVEGAAGKISEAEDVAEYPDADHVQQQQQAVQVGPAVASHQTQTIEEKSAVVVPEQMFESPEAQAKAEYIRETISMHSDGMDDKEKVAFQQKVIAAAQDLVRKELDVIDKEIRHRQAGPNVEMANYDLVSFGELQPLMDDYSVNEIMINGYSGIFIERKGRLEPVEYEFSSESALERLIFKMIAPLGFDLAKSGPIIDTQLPDGTHLNIVLPPISALGPVVTIRKSQLHEFQDEHFIRFGSCSTEMMHFLKQCVTQKQNIVVTGEVGSGKTAMLNILANYLQLNERVITVEDIQELNIKLPHVISLQAGLLRGSRDDRTDSNQMAFGIRHILANALIMRPDRVVIGQCKRSDVLDVLLAMGTECEGFLTSFHARSPRDLINRLEMDILMTKPDLPIHLIREQVLNSIHIIVNMARFSDGSRKITEIVEVSGFEQGQIGIQPVFRFLQKGLSPQGVVWGRFEPMGYVPQLYRRLESVGEMVDKSIFQKSVGPSEHPP